MGDINTEFDRGDHDPLPGPVTKPIDVEPTGSNWASRPKAADELQEQDPDAEEQQAPASHWRV